MGELEEDRVERPRRNGEAVGDHRRTLEALRGLRHAEEDLEGIRERRQENAVPGHDADGEQPTREADVRHHAQNERIADDRARGGHELHVAAAHDAQKTERQQDAAADEKTETGVPKSGEPALDERRTEPEDHARARQPVRDAPTPHFAVAGEGEEDRQKDEDQRHRG